MLVYGWCLLFVNTNAGNKQSVEPFCEHCSITINRKKQCKPVESLCCIFTCISVIFTVYIQLKNINLSFMKTKILVRNNMTQNSNAKISYYSWVINLCLVKVNNSNMIYVVYLYDMNNCIRSAKYECNIKNVLYQTKQTKYVYVEA